MSRLRRGRSREPPGRSQVIGAASDLFLSRSPLRIRHSRTSASTRMSFCDRLPPPPLESGASSTHKWSSSDGHLVRCHLSGTGCQHRVDLNRNPDLRDIPNPEIRPPALAGLQEYRHRSPRVDCTRHPPAALPRFRSDIEVSLAGSLPVSTPLPFRVSASRSERQPSAGQPTSRPCSIDESVAFHHRFR